MQGQQCPQPTGTNRPCGLIVFLFLNFASEPCFRNGFLNDNRSLRTTSYSWWPWRGGNTRSHSEHGSEGPLRRGYCGNRPRESSAPPGFSFRPSDCTSQSGGLFVFAFRFRGTVGPQERPDPLPAGREARCGRRGASACVRARDSAAVAACGAERSGRPLGDSIGRRSASRSARRSVTASPWGTGLGPKRRMFYQCFQRMTKI